MLTRGAKRKAPATSGGANKKAPAATGGANKKAPAGTKATQGRSLRSTGGLNLGPSGAKQAANKNPNRELRSLFR
jgi:hypothetical protein